MTTKKRKLDAALAEVNPVKLAVFKAGSQEALAKSLPHPVARQTVTAWMAKGRFPLSRVPDVAKATGLSVRILAPEFFQ